MSDSNRPTWQQAKEKWEELNSRCTSDVWEDIDNFLDFLEANLPDEGEGNPDA